MAEILETIYQVAWRRKGETVWQAWGGGETTVTAYGTEAAARKVVEDLVRSSQIVAEACVMPFQRGAPVCKVVRATTEVSHG